MPSIGLGEMLLVAVVALVVIGPHELPEAMRKLGVFLAHLKKNARVLTHEMLDVKKDEDQT